MFAEYRPSDSLKSQYFIATGKRLSNLERIEFDPTTLTPEQRTVLLMCHEELGAVWELPPAYTGVKAAHKTARPEYVKYPAFNVFDAQPTIEDWLVRAEANISTKSNLAGAMDEAMEQYRQNVKENIENSVAEKVARINSLIESRAHWEITSDENVSQYTLDDAKRAGVEIDLSALKAAQAKFNELLPTFKAEKEARDAQEKADKETAVEAERQSQLAWAVEHGSERLVMGLRAGYKCSRIYKLERAAQEFPSYVLDLQQGVDWEERVNPSLAALLERKAILTQHPELDTTKVKIVWLTSPALIDPKRDNEWDEDEFTPCEAVVIDSADFDEWLVKII